MMRKPVLILALLAMALPAPLAARADAQDWPARVSRDLVRLGHVEWRLRMASANLCPHRSGAAGIVIDYLGAYSQADRPLVREVAGLGALPKILSVETASPAAGAGLRAGDEIAAIDGTDVLRLAAHAGDRALLSDLIADMIAAVGKGQSIRIEVRRDGRPLTVTLLPEQVCSARLILKTGEGMEAYTDGANVAIDDTLIRFAASDDELALVAGHEYGHVIAADRTPAGLFGRRQAEDEADIEGARLMACAGYDPVAGIAFWKRLAASVWPQARRDPAYRSASSRYERLNAARASLARTSCP